MNQYIFVSLDKDKKKNLYTIPYAKKAEALQQYKNMCEMYPKEHFKVVKRQTIDETIAESDDYRQTKFSF